jgi:Phosphatase
VTRRPKSRLPRKLPDPIAESSARGPKEPTVRERLKRDHVAGRSSRFGREEILGIMRRVVMGVPASHLGLAEFDALLPTHVEAAVTATFGWEGDGPRARIAPSRTIEGFTAAGERVLEVARAGGRIAFATTRPASLLHLYRAVVAAAQAEGAAVLSAEETAVIRPGGQRLWWIDQIAVLTDGVSLLGHDHVEAARELLFVLERPDLVVADRTFAGVALASGLEVVAFADLDAVALAVAAWRGRSVRVVPLDDHRPPLAYQPLIELLDELAASESVGAEARTAS